MHPQPYLLEARSLVKSFGPTRVLRGVDFLVAPGEVHALLGGNGAGKSTLLKIVAGDLTSDGGTLSFAGNNRAASGASTQQIAFVHQELALLPHLSVAENIALPFCQRGISLFRIKAARQAAAAALSLIDPELARAAIDRPVGELALHERQLVEIARALGSGAQLLLLDEPTSNLTAGEAERLFGILRRLVAERGLSVVFVSHRMQEIHQVADVCTILRDGVTATRREPVNTLSDADIIERMGQQQAIDSPQTLRGKKGSLALTPVAGSSLRLRGSGVDVAVGTGEIVGLAGAPAGPASLINSLIGESTTRHWDITFDGRPLTLTTPRQAARAGIGYISGDRSTKGIIGSLPVVDNVLASLRVVERRYLVSRGEPRIAHQLLIALKAGDRSVWEYPAEMSGGTQQKLLIARWLALRPRILVLEEPTRGVDLGTKREIYALIRGWADGGTIAVWWSTEHAELAALCDLVIAFDPHGAPTGVLRKHQLTDETIATATGMAA